MRIVVRLVVALVAFGWAIPAGAQDGTPPAWSLTHIVPACLADPWGSGIGPLAPAYRLCVELTQLLATVDDTTVAYVPAMQVNCSIPGDTWDSYPAGSRAVRFTTTPAFAARFSAGPDQLVRFTSDPTRPGGRWWTLHREVAWGAGYLPPFAIEQFLAIGFVPSYVSAATGVVAGKIAYFGVVGPVTQVDEAGGAAQFYFPDAGAVTAGAAQPLPGAPAPTPTASSVAAAGPASRPRSRIESHDPRCAGYTQLADVLG